MFETPKNLDLTSLLPNSHTHTHTHTHTYTYSHTHTRTHTHAHIHMYTHLKTDNISIISSQFIENSLFAIWPLAPLDICIPDL